MPKQIREHVRFETDQCAEFNKDSNGNVILTSRNDDLHSLKGIVRSHVKKRPVSVKDMNKAIAEGFSKQ
jgi:hypothetical protein